MYKITNTETGEIYYDGYVSPKIPHKGDLSQLAVDAKLDLCYSDIEGIAKINDDWYVLDECGSWDYLPDEYTVEDVNV